MRCTLTKLAALTVLMLAIAGCGAEVNVYYGDGHSGYYDGGYGDYYGDY